MIHRNHSSIPKTVIYSFALHIARIISMSQRIERKHCLFATISIFFQWGVTAATQHHRVRPAPRSARGTDSRHWASHVASFSDPGARRAGTALASSPSSPGRPRHSGVFGPGMATREGRTAGHCQRHHAIGGVVDAKSAAAFSELFQCWLVPFLWVCACFAAWCSSFPRLGTDARGNGGVLGWHI